MNFDKSFFQEEVRSGFLVTEKRKKIWATALQLLEKFDEVCAKYQLRYFAYYGTLLGAVRHQGFIPWDDDIDIAMFREDYERFKLIAPGEFNEPYFFQNAYTDRVIWPLTKIRDSRTTAIEANFQSLRDFNHGIFIDIFPLDSANDGINPQFPVIVEIQKILWMGIMDPGTILKNLEAGEHYVLNTDFLVDYLKKEPLERFKLFEAYNLSQFDKSQKVNYILDELFPSSYKSVDKDWFDEIVYLPFEHIYLPVPAEYDKVLIQSYGDYHKFVHGGSSHENIILEPEIPYIEYFSKYL